MERLKSIYTKEIRKKLKEEFGIKNEMDIPNLVKVVVNAGIGSEYKNNTAIVDEMTAVLANITGQKPVVINSKEAISNFKLREGTPNGLKVTLRGEKMWSFFDKLVNTALPRIKDFRGVSKRSFDTVGNYTMGIKDHTIFPEIDTSTFVRSRTLQVVVNTSAKDRDQALKLLELLGMPFEKRRR